MKGVELLVDPVAHIEAPAPMAFARTRPRPAGHLIAEAKAAHEIVDLWDSFLAQERPDPVAAELARQTLRFLAVPYRSHPDFHEEWSP